MNRITIPPPKATALDIGRWADGNLKSLGFFALRRIREQPGIDAERELCAVGIALCRARATIRDAVAAGREA